MYGGLAFQGVHIEGFHYTFNLSCIAFPVDSSLASPSNISPLLQLNIHRTFPCPSLTNILLIGR